MKRLIFALAALTPVIAFAQSVPTMKRPVTLEGPTGLNAAMALKADAANGKLTTPTISGGTITTPTITTPTITGGNATNFSLTTPTITNGTATGTNIDSAVIDVASIVNALAAGTTTARPISARFADEIHLKDFGAIGDDSTDDTAAVNAWLAVCETGAHACFADAGKYKITQAITISEPHMGMKIYGAGINATLFDFRSVTGNTLSVYAQNGASAFYGTLDDLSVAANVNGPAVRVGRADLSDAINSFEFRNFNINNTNTGSGAIGAQANYVVTTTFSNVTANNVSSGDALQCNECVMDVFSGSFSTATNAIRLSGYSNANTFSSVDLENICNAIVIDSANAVSNTFLSPKAGAIASGCTSSSFFVATGGHGNYVLNPELGPFTTTTAVSGGTTGLIWHSDRFGTTTPDFPSSGSTVTNTTGRNMLVTITNGDVTQIVAGGVTYNNQSQYTGVQSVILPSGATISVTYTGSPAWVWNAL